MIIGKVIGSVVSTRKHDKLIGSKFMIVEPLDGFKDIKGKLVAIDNVGAGFGEIVLVALGSSARIGCGIDTAPIDAAIVGIVDDGSGME
ncbi:MAG: EutN/CcmL family microcompartment protein [Proteocatella sp.]